MSIAASTTETPVLELKDLQVHFTTRIGTLFRRKVVKAVDGISLEIRRGRTVGVVGESGSGKTTLANVIVGLQEPTGGELLYRGRPVGNRSADRKEFGKSITMIFQNASTALNPRMTTHDIIRDPMDVHSMGSTVDRSRRVSELLDLVGLPASAAEAVPAQLSGGQRQRVAIARALSLNPEVIVADEPTSALDVSVRAQVLNLLIDLKDELNLGMVFISHDIQTVRHISDDILVMTGGQAVEQGPADRVLTDPSTDYTRSLLGAAPSLLRGM
ncbi:ATP-binding cassette domain-containing protein [Kocuria sp. HSID16901]|uniref:ATP-binding cassette domain-containing protein n=1 Tax=Kocuria sp. HSID16901 TaxID=2419505 RepID=UPI00066182A0|nr:ATP-binding cassette domain-containing protein [Kocuria sp. HSID16901]MCT1367171.1 ATP-binding cassette domain-containing protein [Rothia sp. p3-SID1597]RUQ21869.1 ABC transporter ATP-binding protein [Kocuria sp. HSID16901]